MRLEIVQKSKELYEADFLILRGDEVVGRMKVRGSMGSVEGVWEIVFQGYEVTILPEKKSMKPSETRPYAVMVDQKAVGRLYLTREKHGFLSSFDTVKLVFMNEDYTLYSLSFDDVGRGLIYSKGQQMAQTEKPGLVIDDMHNYRIFAEKDDYGIIPVLFSAYLYGIGHFRPGVKVRSGRIKYSGRTTNKLLLDKYDPGFIQRCSK